MRLLHVLAACILIMGGVVLQAQKAWTVFVYMAADNDLHSFVQLNLRQMMSVGSNDSLNIVVYLAEKQYGKKTGKKIYIGKNNYKILGIDMNADSGSRQTFLNACEWALQNYPADHYAIIGWDHGSGPLNRIVRGIAYDFTTGNYLTDRDVFEVLKQLNTKIDIIAFDACLMAGIELQAYFAPYVDYTVASQETTPGTGWNYARALSPITASSTPEQVARSWVQAYRDTYANRISDFTLSAVSSLGMLDIAAQVDLLSQKLKQLLLNSRMTKKVIQFLQQVASPKICISFDDPEDDYLDLNNLMHNISNSCAQLKNSAPDSQTHVLIDEIGALAHNIQVLRAHAVIEQTAGSRYSQTGGISIYWPGARAHSSYSKLGWTEQYPHWSALIDSYAYYSKKENLHDLN